MDADIVDRLRESVRACRALDRSALLAEAAAEIMKLRRQERTNMGAMKDLLITIHGGGDEAVSAVQRIGEDWRLQLEAAAEEIERLRLTDAEREAFEGAIEAEHRRGAWQWAATLRGLLERTK